MISWKFKLWRSAGAAAALSLAACGGEAGEVGAQSGGEAGESAVQGEAGEAAPAPPAPPASSGGEQGEAGIAGAYSGLSGDARTALRLQHLKGFVLIAQRQTDANAPAEAAVLVQQGLLEVYDAAAHEFGALDAAPVREAGGGAAAPRADMARRLQAAAAAIDAVRNSLDINRAELAVRMVDISSGLYQYVVQPDFVDPIEYQHSLGAALAARDALVSGEPELRRADRAAYDEALGELDRLIALWPAPSAPEQAASYRQVLAQCSRVRLALSPFL